MKIRKLQLNRETVRTLTAQEMAGVAGGAVRQSVCSCVTCLCSKSCPAVR